MKPSRTLSVFSAAILFGSLLLSATAPGSARSAGEGFSVKEYEDFHQVLHELQHEALPNKDFARIRSQAPELVKLGEAIVRLGVPQGTAAADVAAFEKTLKRFDAALVKFKSDAKTGSDEQLKVSFSVVHDSFEMLAERLPRKP